MLLESYRMYGCLELIDDFGQCGRARSAWRVSSIMKTMGRWGEASTYNAEAEKIRSALGQEPSTCLDEADFNVLLNRMDC